MFVKLLLTFLLRKGYKSLTTWIAASLTATGTAAAFSPEILNAIPTSWRPWLILGYGLFVYVARVKTEFQSGK